MHSSTPIYILKREAKRLARREELPWMEALHRIAKREGYSSWSLLLAKTQERRQSVSEQLYGKASSGELILLASRPGWGKTIVAIECALRAIRQGHQAAFFSLDFSARMVQQKLDEIGASTQEQTQLTIDCSDDISASYIIQQTTQTPQHNAWIVIDYLQLLDQKREHPPLQSQVETLRKFAQETGSIVLFLSQVDRSFEESNNICPDWDDIRLPNPLDLQLFDKACFFHDQHVKFSKKE